MAKVFKKSGPPKKQGEWDRAKLGMKGTIAQGKLNQENANLRQRTREDWPAEVRAEPGTRVKKIPAGVGKGGR